MSSPKVGLPSGIACPAAALVRLSNHLIAHCNPYVQVCLCYTAFSVWPAACSLHAGGVLQIRSLRLRVRSLTMGTSPSKPAKTAHLENPITRLELPPVFRANVSSRLELHDATLLLPTCAALEAFVNNACEAWAYAPYMQVSATQVFECGVYYNAPCRWRLSYPRSPHTLLAKLHSHMP